MCVLTMRISSFLKGLLRRCWGAVGFDGVIAVLPALFHSDFRKTFRHLFLVASVSGLCALVCHAACDTVEPGGVTFHSNLTPPQKTRDAVGRPPRSHDDGGEVEVQGSETRTSPPHASKRRGSFLVGLTLFPMFTCVVTSFLPAKEMALWREDFPPALFAASLFGATLPLGKSLWVLFIPLALLFGISHRVLPESLGGTSQQAWLSLVVSCLHLCAMYAWHRRGKSSMSLSEASVLSQAFASLLLWSVCAALQGPFKLSAAVFLRRCLPSPFHPTNANFVDLLEPPRARFAHPAAFAAHMFLPLLLLVAFGVFVSLALQPTFRMCALRCAFVVFSAWVGIFLFMAEVEVESTKEGLERGGRSPVLWLLEFAFVDSHWRLLLQWSFVSVVGVGAAFWLSSGGALKDGGSRPRSAEARLACVRKVFHAVLVFNTFLGIQAQAGELLLLAFMGALWILILLETLRCLQLLPGLSSGIDTLYARFIDARDQGGLVFTHTLLLMGVGVPLAIPSSAEFLGLLLVGIGDAAAAIVGATMGAHAMPFQTHKSAEGFAAFVGSSFLCGCVLSLLDCGRHAVSRRVLVKPRFYVE